MEDTLWPEAAAYKAHRDYVDGLIDEQFEEIGASSTIDTRTGAASEALMRLHIAGGFKTGETDSLKRDTMVHVIAAGDIDFDSPWVIVANEVVPGDLIDVTDPEFQALVAEERARREEIRSELFHQVEVMQRLGLLDLNNVDVDNPLSSEEAQARLDSLSPEQRAEYDALFDK